MIRSCIAVFVIVMLAAPVDAQSRRELARRLDAVEAQFAEAEAQRISQMDQLLSRLADLEYQVQEANGQVERLQFENRQLGQRVEAQDRELESLRRQIERLRRPAEPQFDEDGNPIPDTMADGDDEAEMPASSSSGGPRNLTGARLAVTDSDDPFAADRAAATRPLGQRLATAEDRAPPISANQAYGQARSKLLDGDFDGAQEDFSRFIADFPEDELIDEAWFWLGETHYVRGEYSSAAEAYIASLREERNGSVAPDALVRLASSLAALGRIQEACSTLARFSREFPSAGPNATARAERESLRAGCR
ncbi:tetratricopeptide repeat protein [Hyphobacterium sp.]|uniref:tetratricopeptide repeat protein n=1 Tax=Hyphobacterium sp. TaxID=2004662 RepID=UPI003BA8EB95